LREVLGAPRRVHAAGRARRNDRALVRARNRRKAGSTGKAAPMKRTSTMLCFGGLLLAAGRHRKKADAQAAPPEEAPVQVATTSVAERPMPRFLSLTGSLTPNQSSEVAADTLGKILETKVERGSFVEKNAVIAKVDPRTAGLQAAEANANVE